jgi:hypothetical protein
MDSYITSNGSCFMVTWTIFKNHLLAQVGLTQNWETMTLQMLTNIELFYFIIYKDLHWIEIHWNCIWLRDQSHMTSHCRVRDHTIWVWRYVWDNLWALSFGPTPESKAKARTRQMDMGWFWHTHTHKTVAILTLWVCHGLDMAAMVM